MGVVLKKGFSRRRTLVIVAGLACISANIAWQMTHRHNVQLVGDWIVTSDPPSGWEERWEFNQNGTGFREWRSERTPNRKTNTSVMEGFFWWTNGKQVSLKWGTNAFRGRWERFRELSEELDCAISGKPDPFPIYRYSFVVENDRLIHIKPDQAATNPGYEIMSFSRVGTE